MICTENNLEKHGWWIEARVKGHIDLDWSERLAGLNLCHNHLGQTELKGTIKDLSAFYGLIWQLRDTGMELLAIEAKKNK